MQGGFTKATATQKNRVKLQKQDPLYALCITQVWEWKDIVIM